MNLVYLAVISIELNRIQMSRPTVIDFFCGAGGFSEGFRQKGFEILRGYDKWQPAIDTFSFNFGKSKGVFLDILSLDSEEAIHYIENEIPDTHVILGSPPCVSFSSSNRSGKADKALGIKLIEVFLKIVAIKKYKKNSALCAWFMENVARSKDHIESNYSFHSLGLEKWARKRKLDPHKVAIRLKENTVVLNAADYGSPQQRLRAVSGEIIKEKRFIVPQKVRSVEDYVTLGYIRSKLPPPNSRLSMNTVVDPLYENIVLPQNQLTDHFYDSGLYESCWLSSKYLKTNHPYMGRMSFPENEKKPSRTVTATKIGTSREALIYKSEYNRKGDGQYRIPTVREAATIMSFPITFQFLGTESSKWKLIGNAVCPTISRALAGLAVKYIDGPVPKRIFVTVEAKTKGVPDLNDYKEKKFDDPPKKNKGSRFRRHPFKDGNITVTLSNYDIKNGTTVDGKWMTSVQYGNGNGFPHQTYPDDYFKSLEPMILNFEGGFHFLETINNGFSEKIANSRLLQQMYEENRCIDSYLEPSILIEEVSKIINKFNFDDPILSQKRYFKFKSAVPKKQILALYAINKISSQANQLAMRSKKLRY